MGTKNRDEFASGGLHNTLSPGTVVKGDIETDGDFRLDGTVEGNVTCGAKIVIGPKAIVKGNIHSVNAEVMGTIQGDIYTSGLLLLKESAVVEGNICIQTLQIEPNAQLNGSCKMAGNTSTL